MWRLLLAPRPQSLMHICMVSTAMLRKTAMHDCAHGQLMESLLSSTPACFHAVAGGILLRQVLLKQSGKHGSYKKVTGFTWR